MPISCRTEYGSTEKVPMNADRCILVVLPRNRERATWIREALQQIPDEAKVTTAPIKKKCCGAGKFVFQHLAGLTKYGVCELASSRSCCSMSCLPDIQSTAVLCCTALHGAALHRTWVTDEDQESGISIRYFSSFRKSTIAFGFPCFEIIQHTCPPFSLAGRDAMYGD